MTTWRNDCENAVAPGTNWTVGNQGAGEDALTVTITGGTVQTTTTGGEVIFGSKSVKLAPGGAFTTRLSYVTPAVTSMAMRGYVRLAAAPAADTAICYLQGTTGASAIVKISASTGRIRLENAAGAMVYSPAPVLSYPCVVGVDLTINSGTSTADGSGQISFFNQAGAGWGDSGVLTGQNFYRTGGGLVQARWELSSNWTAIWDALEAHDVYGLVGPVSTSVTGDAALTVGESGAADGSLGRTTSGAVAGSGVGSATGVIGITGVVGAGAFGGASAGSAGGTVTHGSGAALPAAATWTTGGVAGKNSGGGATGVYSGSAVGLVGAGKSSSGAFVGVSTGTGTSTASHASSATTAATAAVSAAGSISSLDSYIDSYIDSYSSGTVGALACVGDRAATGLVGVTSSGAFTGSAAAVAVATGTHSSGAAAVSFSTGTALGSAVAVGSATVILVKVTASALGYAGPAALAATGSGTADGVKNTGAVGAAALATTGTGSGGGTVASTVGASVVLSKVAVVGSLAGGAALVATAGRVASGVGVLIGASPADVSASMDAAPVQTMDVTDTYADASVSTDVATATLTTGGGEAAAAGAVGIAAAAGTVAHATGAALTGIEVGSSVGLVSTISGGTAVGTVTWGGGVCIGPTNGHGTAGGQLFWSGTAQGPAVAVPVWERQPRTGISRIHDLNAMTRIIRYAAVMASSREAEAACVADSYPFTGAVLGSDVLGLPGNSVAAMIAPCDPIPVSEALSRRGAILINAAGRAGVCVGRGRVVQPYGRRYALTTPTTGDWVSAWWPDSIVATV